MSNSNKKLYPAEFKESAVKLAIESGKTAAETARELGVNVNTMHSWIRQRSRPKSQSQIHREVNYDFDEIKRLKKELAQAILERDILKKATAYFAKEYK